MPEPINAGMYPGANYPTTVDTAFLQRREEADFNKFTQTAENMINELDLFLSGSKIERDQLTGNYLQSSILKPGEKPVMNMKGREFVKARLKTYVNSNLYLAGIKKDDADYTFKLDIANFACDLFGSLREYEMTRAAAKKVCNQVAPIMYFALRKSETDKEAIYRGMRSQNQAPQGGGIRSALAAALGGSGPPPQQY